MSCKRPVALCIMAKLPRPGDSKTRLSPAISPEDAAALSRAFIADTIANVANIARGGDATAWVAYAPPATPAELIAAFGPGVQTLAQRGNDFGARLYNVASDLIARGHRAVCLIDSDSPTLPPAALQRAVEMCDGSDRVVLGPAADGGYYLLGVARAHRQLFEGIAWSTSSVARDTLARARAIELPISLLRDWYDIDEPTDLETLAEEFRTRRPAGGFHAPATRAVMEKLFKAPPAAALASNA